MKGTFVETKFEKSSIIRQPNAFKSQRQSILGKPDTFSDSLAKKDFSKSQSVTINNLSNDLSNPVTAQILPQNVNIVQKNTNVIAPGMYKVHTRPNQTRTTQLPQNIRKTNKHASFSTEVIPTTSVSRPQLKSNQLEDRVMHNNSPGKRQQVEDHHRNFKFSNNKKSVTTCNDSLNAKTSNVNLVCVTCGKCMMNDNHDMCVLHYINGVNSRTKQPIVVPISTKEPKQNLNQSVATPLKKTVAAESTNQKPRSTTRKQYEHFRTKSTTTNILESITLRGSTLSNTPLSSNSFAARTVKFGNDQIAPILGYGNLVQGNITIKRVYYVEGLNHNLLSVGQLCDADLEVPFWKSACYISSLSQARLCRLSHLNFDTIKLLLKYDSVTGLPKLKLVKDHLCSSCEVGKAIQSFNGKKYVLVIVDDYSRYTWTHFLRYKDETPEVLIDFLKLVQRGLHAQVRTVRTDKGTKFLNKTFHAYFAQEGIEHQTSTARIPEQNGIVKRQNRTFLEVARTMLSAAKVPLFFWAKAIATTCFTQNGENLDKMKEKGDACIFVGHYAQSRAYRVYNKRTKVIVETIHVNFDELPQMASDHISSDPVPQCLTMALEQDSLSPDPKSQENVPQVAESVTTSNELDLLYSLMFDELLNVTTPVVSKSFIVHAADAPNQYQQQNTTPSTSTTIIAYTPSLIIQTTPKTTSQAPTHAPTVIATKNINQA
ncbi:retrovirus-related pol polyprotein from transposon TNT 1-94 [Tanacetum coccineum]